MTPAAENFLEFADVGFGGRRRSGVAEQARALVTELAAAVLPARDRRLAQRLLLGAIDMIASNPGTLDLKIAAATIEEMGDAYRVFAPYSAAPKVTIFGSARTTQDDPLYAQARDVAARTRRARMDDRHRRRPGDHGRPGWRAPGGSTRSA